MPGTCIKHNARHDFHLWVCVLLWNLSLNFIKFHWFVPTLLRVGKVDHSIHILLGLRNGNYVHIIPTSACSRAWNDIHAYRGDCHGNTKS